MDGYPPSTRFQVSVAGRQAASDHPVTPVDSSSASVYIRYAREAWAAGDCAAARLFAELAGDEAGHAARFMYALQELELPH